MIDGSPPLPTVVGCYPTAGSTILFADFILLILNETSKIILTPVCRYLRFVSRYDIDSLGRLQIAPSFTKPPRYDLVP